MKQDYTHEDIDASATGTTELGPVNIHRFGADVRAVLATVEQSNADAEFNVNLDGDAIFSSAQSVDAADTLETVTPDQNRFASGENVSLEFEVTSAGTGTFIVGVLLETTDD